MVVRLAEMRDHARGWAFRQKSSTKFNSELVNSERKIQPVLLRTNCPNIRIFLPFLVCWKAGDLVGVVLLQCKTVDFSTAASQNCLMHNSKNVSYNYIVS